MGFATGADHPDLAAHDTLGLATQAELDGHVSGASHPPLADVAPASTSASSGAVGVSSDAAREDHRHGYVTGTPSTQAFGDAAAVGTADALARSDHKHAMPTNPVPAHEAAADPHPGYRLESAQIQTADIANGAVTAVKVAADVATQAELDAHAAAADPHPGYLTQAEGDARYPLGTLGYAEYTANQSSITTETDLLGRSVTVTVAASRRIRITGYAKFISTVAGDNAYLEIEDGTGARLQKVEARNLATGTSTPAIAVAVETPAAGSHTFKLRAARESGSGSVSAQATAAEPSFILVEDIGPA